MDKTLASAEFKYIKEYSAQITRLELENLDLKYELAEARIKLKEHRVDMKPLKGLKNFLGV